MKKVRLSRLGQGFRFLWQMGDNVAVIWKGRQCDPLPVVAPSDVMSSGEVKTETQLYEKLLSFIKKLRTQVMSLVINNSSVFLRL